MFPFAVTCIKVVCGVVGRTLASDTDDPETIPEEGGPRKFIRGFSKKFKNKIFSFRAEVDFAITVKGKNLNFTLHGCDVST